MPVTTPRARRLGAALREARLARQVGVRQLALQLGRDHSLISRFESGERTPKPEDVATILAILGVTGHKRDEILDLSRHTDHPRWLAVTLPEQHQQLAALLDFERTATAITEVSPLLIPGFLQTRKYIRAIMTAGGVPPNEIETRVTIRMRRRETINSMKLLALIGEAALRQEVGGPVVMLEQLHHLLKMTNHSNVDLRIIPFRADWHPALSGSFIVIESADFDPVVHLENRPSGMFLHQHQDVDTYRAAVGAILDVALSQEDSARLIADLIHEKGTS